jgi:hypothetical protein
MFEKFVIIHGKSLPHTYITMDGRMRDYLMLASVVSRSPSMMDGKDGGNDAGFVSKANEILGGDMFVIGRVGQVRLNDTYIGGWDDLVSGGDGDGE